MTGFGKAETIVHNIKFSVEIRSLNGKTCDISLKAPFIPREKEMELRKLITQTLVRGNIDVFIDMEYIDEQSAKTINSEVLLHYYHQIKDICRSTDLSECGDDQLLTALLRLPDVVNNPQKELTDDTWDSLQQCIQEAMSHLIAFREKEGAVLREDVAHRVELISSTIPKVEQYEKERIDTIRQKFNTQLSDIPISPDSNRLEQEIIFYIEKLDINEEKVRLAQHCRYFIETIDNEPFPGKKLSFIAQEMGREINTLGSKANHSQIQKLVVQMKDELEKIKEQSLNIL